MTLKIAPFLLPLLLAACLPVPAAPTATPTLTPTTFPTPTFTPLPTSTSLLPTVIPSPLPTSIPVPIFTPNAVQVQRWKEYQAAIARIVLPDLGWANPDFDYSTVLCEWDILGGTDREVYVWAICQGNNMSDRIPAALYLASDGSVLKSDGPRRGTGSWDSDKQRLFPPQVLEKITQYYNHGMVWPPFDRAEALLQHLLYRASHIDVPPLIIVESTPTS